VNRTAWFLDYPREKGDSPQEAFLISYSRGNVMVRRRELASDEKETLGGGFFL
jgi:hypothetical protein